MFDEQLEVRGSVDGAEAFGVGDCVSRDVYELLVQPWFGVLDASGKEKKFRPLGCSANEVTLTTVKDIKQWTAEIRFVEPRVRDNFMAGETVSYGRVAHVVEECWGKGS